MCTVSIVWHAGGVRLVSNRDERRTRARASVPRVHEVGSQRVVYPTDPEGGGTWVGVNSDGLIAALLNRTDSSSAATSAATCRRIESRGAVVPHVLAAATMHQALDRVRDLAGEPFAPFRLALVRHRALWIVTGGGTAGLTIESHPLLTSFVLASSALGDRLVEAPRRMLFHTLQAAHERDPLEAQAVFHRHRWPARPEISVLMSRADARTVSRTRIDVPAGTSMVRTGWGRLRRKTRIALEYCDIADTGDAPC